MPKDAKFAKLNGENYTRWAFCMEVFLRKKKLWSIVDTGIPGTGVSKYVVSEKGTEKTIKETGGERESDDEEAKLCLVNCVEDSQLAYFANAQSAHEWWMNLREAYLGTSRATLSQLLKDCTNIGKHASSVEERYVKLTEMNDRIGGIDKDAVWKEMHLVAL